MRIITENALRRKGFIYEKIDGKRTGKFILCYYRPNTNITEYTIKLTKYSISVWMLLLTHEGKWSGQSMIDSLESLDEYTETFMRNLNVLSKIQWPYLLDLGFKMLNPSTFIWKGEFGTEIKLRETSNLDTKYSCTINSFGNVKKIGSVSTLDELDVMLGENDLDGIF